MHSDVMTSSGAHGYLAHLRAETVANARHAVDRLGRYGSAVQAERALDPVRARHVVWNADARWEGKVA